MLSDFFSSGKETTTEHVVWWTIISSAIESHEQQSRYYERDFFMRRSQRSKATLIQSSQEFELYICKLFTFSVQSNHSFNATQYSPRYFFLCSPCDRILVSTFNKFVPVINVQMKSLNKKKNDISIFINLRYLRLNLLKNKENNKKICHIFHNFCSICWWTYFKNVEIAVYRFLNSNYSNIEQWVVSMIPIRCVQYPFLSV